MSNPVHSAVHPDDRDLREYPETLLLRDEDVARWCGVKLGYFSATNRTGGHRWLEFPSVGLISEGTARWYFRSGLRHIETQIGPAEAGQVLGVFGSDFEFDRSEWECHNARRLIVETKHADYERFDLEDMLLTRPLRHQFAVVDNDLVALLRAMLREIVAGCPHGKLYAESLSLGLLRHLHTEHGEVRCGSMRGSSRCLTATQIARVREFIRENLATNLSLVELANVSGVSPAYFASIFRDTFGMTPHNYVLGQRIANARRLLSATATSLVDIALTMGFSSQSHFNSAFLRETGVTPGAYRRQLNS